MATTEEYRYYRWAGFLLRQPARDPGAAEILKRQQWTPAPREAIDDVGQLPDEHPAGGWCARLSGTEAARMAAGFGVTL